ncbi:MAG: ABC transporter permease [Ignavibacteriales bacterium]|nr:ABC transporter permease [Ignavibacteriales bacterium]
MKFLGVAKWEFIEKVKSKAFIISLVLMPIIIVAFSVIPGLLVTKPDERSITIGVIDETNEIFDPLAARLNEKYTLPDKRPNYTLERIRVEGDLATTKQIANVMTASEEVQGYFHIPASVYDSGKVEYRAPNVGNIRLQERFSRTIEEVVVEKRLSSKGYDPKLIRNLMTDVDIRSIKINDKGEEKESGFLETFFSAYIVIMMLLFLVMTSGQLLIRSVVEEKSNRVIEVLLSSCSARDLMTGKILGLGGLGIVQMMVWGLIGLAVTLQTKGAFFAPEHMLLSLVYFILGYLLYSAIFVAAGSPVTTEQEAQQITTYVSLLLVFPIVLAMPVMQNPGSIVFRVLSFVPILTPAFMVMRIPIQMPPLWEILTTIVILLISSVAMMWVAGKIFRVAILVTGKRPTLPELFRWVREP